MKRNVYLNGSLALLALTGGLLFGSLRTAGAGEGGSNTIAPAPAAKTESELPAETETELPAEPVPMSPEAAGLREGCYSFEGELTGGSGKAHFDGPLFLTVEEDGCFLTFTMSSAFYDYVLVDGERYDPLETEGNSTFRVPLAKLNEDFCFTADTTAMSEPHEIDYSVRINADALTYLGEENIDLYRSKAR